MKIENTTKLPLAVFHVPAGEGNRSGKVLAPGASIEVDLQQGDTLHARVHTESLDPPDEPAAKDAEAPATAATKKEG